MSRSASSFRLLERLSVTDLSELVQRFSSVGLMEHPYVCNATWMSTLAAKKPMSGTC